MHFLIFMDGLRADLVGSAYAILLIVALSLLRASKRAGAWRRTLMRLTGFATLILFASLTVVFALGSVLGGDPPREHTKFVSPSGSRFALLSHSALRDGAATQVSVKEGCCRRRIPYEYFGSGDDYMDGGSLKWIDDHHLLIRYALDASGEQRCDQRAGDVTISCEPRHDPFPDKSTGTKP
jgi:hypothetical protein